ncbi:MAG: TrkA family potassium uptake protein [Sulfurovaceae bacterium]|nr:TrkA family potassium uptake protein [Sulfurovaceae bacterium]
MKQYVVIGLGKFGHHVAKGLGQQGASVIGIDTNEEHIREVSEYIEEAISLDSTDKYALEEAGVRNADVGIVSIGEDIEASILTVMALKDLGVKTIIAKAASQVHGQILAKIGANNIIYPERQVAKKLVKNLIEHTMIYETIDLSVSMKIAKMIVPKFWVGISILSNTFGEQYNVKPIAYKHHGTWYTKFESDDILESGDIIVVIGNNNDVETLSKRV